MYQKNNRKAFIPFHNNRRVTLHPNPAYQPKVITLTIDFRFSDIDLVAFFPPPLPIGAGGEAAYLRSGLFPIHSCRAYKDTAEL